MPTPYGMSGIYPKRPTGLLQQGIIGSPGPFDFNVAPGDPGGNAGGARGPLDFSPTAGLGGLQGRSGFGGNELSSGIDFSKLLGRFADVTYGKYEPFEDFSLNFLGDIAKGGGQYLNQLLAPAFSALSSQLPNAQRRLNDTVSGGARAEGQIGLEENLQGAQSQMTSQVLNWALGQLLDTGLGATGRIYPLLAAAGQIAKKPAKGGK